MNQQYTLSILLIKFYYKGGGKMEIYIGIGFIILCLALLVFVTGIVGYTIKLTRKELDVAPTKSTSSSNSLDQAQPSPLFIVNKILLLIINSHIYYTYIILYSKNFVNSHIFKTSYIQQTFYHSKFQDYLQIFCQQYYLAFQKEQHILLMCQLFHVIVDFLD